MSYSEAYDPTAPEGEVVSRGHYVTKRDLRILLGGFGLVLVALIPVYYYMKGGSDRARCTQNMNGIVDALSQYAAEHDGRYPPICRTETIGGFAPGLGDTGDVYTWASDISGYMTKRASFLCPSAKPEELVRSEDPNVAGKTFVSSYGMYEPLGGYLVNLVENPDAAVVIAETSNQGAEKTFDPLPFNSLASRPLPDGFVIGWNDSNSDATNATTAVTRLALPDSAAGVFKKTGTARHGNRFHMLTAAGSLILATPDYAHFKGGAGLGVSQNWTVPPGWETHAH